MDLDFQLEHLVALMPRPANTVVEWLYWLRKNLIAHITSAKAQICNFALAISKRCVRCGRKNNFLRPQCAFAFNVGITTLVPAIKIFQSSIFALFAVHRCVLPKVWRR